MTPPRVAVFRPADERLAEAVTLLESAGVEPVPDPMLAIEPTGARPRSDADMVILTSKSGVELVSEAGWESGSASVCAIGPKTARVLRDCGYSVDIVPDEYSSDGLVSTLVPTVEGTRIEIARSDHGSDVLIDGLNEAGAYVHETVLYKLVRPPDSGRSVTLAADGKLDAACFTSSLTVEHVLEAATERGLQSEVRDGLNDAVVGTIGEPTRSTAESHGITVDVVPADATADSLLHAVVDRLEQ